MTILDTRPQTTYEEREVQLRAMLRSCVAALAELPKLETERH